MWLPLLTFLLGFGGSLALEMLRQRAEDSREERRRRSEEDSLRRREERAALFQLQGTLDDLRRDSAIYCDAILRGAPPAEGLSAGFARAQVLWSRLPPPDLQEAARKAALECLTIVDYKHNPMQLREDLPSFVDRSFDALEAFHDALARRLREL